MEWGPITSTLLALGKKLDCFRPSTIFSNNKLGQDLYPGAVLPPNADGFLLYRCKYVSKMARAKACMLWYLLPTRGLITLHPKYFYQIWNTAMVENKVTLLFATSFKTSWQSPWHIDCCILIWAMLYISIVIINHAYYNTSFRPPL